MTAVQPGADLRTTPRWARPFVAALLIAYVGLQVLAVIASADANVLPAALRFRVLPLGQWSMFSEPGSRHHVLEVYALRGGDREPVDLAAHFPTRWESGLRFERRSILRTAKIRLVAKALCGRIATADPARGAPDVVVLSEAAWRRRPGRRPGPPPAKAEREELLRWRCAEAAPERR